MKLTATTSFDRTENAFFSMLSNVEDATQDQLATLVKYCFGKGATPEEARKALMDAIRASGLKGTLRFERSEPQAQQSEQRLPSMATEKQIKFAMNLQDQRELGELEPLNERQLELLSKRQIGERIDQLLKNAKKDKRALWGQPRAEASAEEGGFRITVDVTTAPKKARITEDGIYKVNGVIYKVQQSTETGHLYAKKLVHVEGDKKGKFVFEAGALSKLSPENRLSSTEAAEFGKLYGFCCVCGRTLTNEKSIEAGIGPICADKL